MEQQNKTGSPPLVKPTTIPSTPPPILNSPEIGSDVIPAQTPDESPIITSDSDPLEAGKGGKEGDSQTGRGLGRSWVDPLCRLFRDHSGSLRVGQSWPQTATPTPTIMTPVGTAQTADRRAFWVPLVSLHPPTRYGQESIGMNGEVGIIDWFPGSFHAIEICFLPQ